MMCFAWNPKASCYNAGVGSCPSILWFWLAAAGALILGSRSKGNGAR